MLFMVHFNRWIWWHENVEIFMWSFYYFYTYQEHFQTCLTYYGFKMSNFDFRAMGNTQEWVYENVIGFI